MLCIYDGESGVIGCLYVYILINLENKILIWETKTTSKYVLCIDDGGSGVIGCLYVYILINLEKKILIWVTKYVLYNTRIYLFMEERLVSLIVYTFFCM